MSAYRRNEARKGTSNLVRTSLRHRDRRRDEEDNEQSAIEESLAEWAEEMEDDGIWNS